MTDESRTPFTPTLFGGCFLCDGKPEILIRTRHECYVALCRVCCQDKSVDLERKFEQLSGAR